MSALLMHNGEPIDFGTRLETRDGTPYRFVGIVSAVAPGKSGKVLVEPWKDQEPDVGITVTYSVRVVPLFPSLAWSEDV